MIKLIKLTEPDVLSRNFNKWTEQHLSNITSGINSSDYLKTRYSHADIKEQLIKETNGKCAYCESKLLHIHHGDIEHIYPKSLDESKRFLWINLTLSCEICNQNKTNLDPNLNNIQDPYSGNPEEVIVFCGSLALGSGVKGLSTHTILDLNRKQLIEKRQEKLEKILLIFSQICTKALPKTVRQAIYNDMIKNETSSDKEYSSMVKNAISHISNVIPNDIKQN
ncbi:hypothetical protein C9446_04655 [Providencia heimbachae]|uniref:HNH endonuclease n=1 Tax=Providencia heimbachae TaxID=333962 RepID=UPI0010BF1B3C|nr:HNH endonuclease [Providencia heimbachae]QCJ69212.1 hypothetical protein C9446_04655 [Providencia heimbachae]